jgi:hypothetical protein
MLLEDWFSAKAPVVKQISNSSSREKAESANEKHLISLLDSKRTQTMLIVLAKINKTPEEIVDISKPLKIVRLLISNMSLFLYLLTFAVVNLDPMVLTHDMTLSLLDILPNAEGKKITSTTSTTTTTTA